MTDKIFVLDDGSPGSKLIQEEFKDQYNIQTIKVNPKDNLVEQFTKVDNKDRIKIFLPFSADELVENNELLRREIQQVEAVGFKNLIVLPYEGSPKYDIEFRAKKLGKNSESLKGVKKDIDEEKGGTFRSRLF